MSDTDHRLCNSLLIDDLPVCKIRLQPETFQQHSLQYLYLHLPHDLHMDSGRMRVLTLHPGHMEQGFFLLQPAKLSQHLHRIASRRQRQTIG